MTLRDRHDFVREVRRMKAEGITDHRIARALNLTLGTVRELLAEEQCSLKPTDSERTAIDPDLAAMFGRQAWTWGMRFLVQPDLRPANRGEPPCAAPQFNVSSPNIFFEALKWPV